MDSDQRLRIAVAALSARERAVLIDHLRKAADQWRPHLPRIAAFWATVADLAAEVDHSVRIREAAGPLRQHPNEARWRGL